MGGRIVPVEVDISAVARGGTDTKTQLRQVRGESGTSLAGAREHESVGRSVADISSVPGLMREATLAVTHQIRSRTVRR